MRGHRKAFGSAHEQQSLIDSLSETNNKCQTYDETLKSILIEAQNKKICLFTDIIQYF